MFDDGCWKIVCIPMYPQYASSTTGSVVDKIGDTLKAMRWQPTIRVSPPFCLTKYIAILAKSVRKQLDTLDEQPEVLVASFHGVPKEYLLKGDPITANGEDWPTAEESTGMARGSIQGRLSISFWAEEVVKAICR